MWGHESCSLGSEYILKRILRLQARLLVSCFSRLGLDLPLKPEEEKQTVRAEKGGGWRREGWRLEQRRVEVLAVKGGGWSRSADKLMEEVWIPPPAGIGLAHLPSTAPSAAHCWS